MYIMPEIHAMQSVINKLMNMDEHAEMKMGGKQKNTFIWLTDT